MKLNKKILVCVIISLLLYGTKVIAEPIQIIPIPDTIPEKIEYYADKYNVSSELMTQIISCETANTFNPKIQSRVVYKFSSSKRGIVKGTREQSFGLSQIHLPDHPNVSYEEATDADFALDFMASKISDGQANIWSCYKNIKGV